MADETNAPAPTAPPVVDVDLRASSFQIQRITSEDGKQMAVRLVMVVHWSPDEATPPTAMTVAFVFGSAERAADAGKNLLEAAALVAAATDN